jgi:MFS family permease
MARAPLTPDAAVALRRRVGACLGARGLASASFLWPVLFPFYAGFADLSPSPVFWLVAAYGLGCLAADRPVAHLAARIGRRPLLIAASGTGAVACALVLVGAEPISFAVGQFLLGVARAARDAATPGLLAATLADFGQDEDAPLLEERALVLEAIVSLASALASGFLLESWLLGPYLFTLVAAAGELACAVLLDEPRRPPRRPERRELATAVREIAHAPALVRTILFAAIAAALSLAVRFAQQPYLEAAGLPTAWLGVVAAAAGALRIAADGDGGGAFRERWLAGPISWIAASWVAVLGMTLVRHPAVGLLLLLRGGGDGTRERDLRRVVDVLVAPAHRAEASAVVALAGRLGAIVTAVLLAVLVDRIGLEWALGALALTALVLTLVVAWIPIRPGPPRERERADITIHRPSSSSVTETS